MKFAVILLCLVSTAFSAPQPRKIFHENVEDFLDLIAQEVGEDLNTLLESYIVHEEFVASFEYMQTTDFKELVYEMESLPEFVALQEFLDTHSVDITYLIDLFNANLENGVDKARQARKALKARQSISGTNFKSYIEDSIALLPKEKLAALFDEKMATDPDFKAAMEGLQSEEFFGLFDALFENPVFLAEVQTLAANGIDVGALFDEAIAIFGQN